MARKRWIKLWTQETLFGTTAKELEPAERAVWYGFLALAGDSPTPGTICVSPEVPYTRTQMCQVLNVKRSLLNRAIDKMFVFGKISVNGDGCFTIVNWERYQGDYVRMQKSRERHKGDSESDITDVTPNVTAGTEQSRTEEEEEEEVEQRKGGQPPLIQDNELAIINETFEDKTGQLITPNDGNRIEDLRQQFPASWISDAVIEAVDATDKWPGWNYVEAILKRWQRDGPNSRKGKADGDEPDLDPKRYLTGKYKDLIQH